MTKLNSSSRIKLVAFAFLLVLALAIVMQNAYAKVFTIQNESVNMFVVNGSSGNILLNPNAGFGNIGIIKGEFL